MRILIGSAELHPYSKTGGLADMAAALAKALAKAGHQVGVVTPLFRGVRERFPELRPMAKPMLLPLDRATLPATVWTARPRDHETIYFVDQPALYQRAGLYQERGGEYADNAERFGFLCKAVVYLARHLPWRPEVVHVHDWHLGFVPLLLEHQRRHDGWARAPRHCFTIHNLAYQGNYPPAKYPLLNLPWDYFRPDGVEFYGYLSFMKAGIAQADALTTVSPQYAREILTPEYGHGMDGVLRARQGVLTGILNGVDYDEWRTRRNPFLVQAYSARDLGKKVENKRAVQVELGLPVRPEVPLFGTVSRLVAQKGLEIELAALEELLAVDLQFVLLGCGEPELETAFQALQRRYPAKVAVRLGYAQGLAHRIEAACDFFLMPSRFEPCGLNQMYSLRYGTIPIVHATGGLQDSVRDPREDLAGADGIKFHEYSAAALAKAMRKALVLYQTPALLDRFRRNGMAAEFSWKQTAEQYVEVYSRVLAA